MLRLDASYALATPPPRPRPSRLRPVTVGVRVDPEPRPNLVEVDAVSKVFASSGRAGVAAVDAISIRIPEHSMTLIQGPSGSGKTTLLAIIGCMMRPTAGRVTVAGHDTTRLSEDLLAEVRRRHFGFVFQSNHLIQRATALENVMVPVLPCPEFNGDLRLRALSLLSRLGLEAKAHRRVQSLSGGEQQRVAIARALVNDPEVLIADEPTAHLDRGCAEFFMRLTIELVNRGTSVIVASHDPAVRDAAAFGEIVELRDGRRV